MLPTRFSPPDLSTAVVSAFAVRNPKRLQQLCDGLSAAKIDALLRKWLTRLPHPFTGQNRKAGYRYDVSILQAELSLTQVLDRPWTGRIFFDEVIRENLDLGRPDQVQLIFGRRVTKQTPGRFRTRVLTEGVTPSLHSDYKRSRIKQYHKEGRALRTETTINESRDFRLGKRLVNLPALRQIGFQANRRLLDVQQISQDCAVGEDAFRRLSEPVLVEDQRASALRFADATVQALLSALLVFRLLPRGFSNRDLRDHWTPLLGKTPEALTPGQMTYHLRRLRLHGLIERVPKSHRYRVTTAAGEWRCSAPGPIVVFCGPAWPRSSRKKCLAIPPYAAAWTNSCSVREKVPFLELPEHDLEDFRAPLRRQGGSGLILRRGSLSAAPAGTKQGHHGGKEDKTAA